MGEYERPEYPSTVEAKDLRSSSACHDASCVTTTGFATIEGEDDSGGLVGLGWKCRNHLCHFVAKFGDVILYMRSWCYCVAFFVVLFVLLHLFQTTVTIADWQMSFIHIFCVFSNESSDQELLIQLHPGHRIDGYNDALNRLVWGFVYPINYRFLMHPRCRMGPYLYVDI